MFYNKLKSSNKLENSKMFSTKSRNQKTQSRIKHQTRLQLIKLVEEERFSIKLAANYLKINYSTAKLIIKKYQKDGSVTKFTKQKERVIKQKTQMTDSASSQDLRPSICDQNPNKNYIQEQQHGQHSLWSQSAMLQNWLNYNFFQNLYIYQNSPCGIQLIK